MTAMAQPNTSAASLITLDCPVTQLHGVGAERASQLARLGIQTTADLLLHRPRRYENRQHFRSIREMQLGESG